MKSPHLYIALIFASILAFQAHSFKLSTSQEPLSLTPPPQASTHVGFKQLLKEAYAASGSSQTVANVLKYYIDGTTYFNYIQKLFCEANTAGGETITLEQFYAVTDDQGIHRIDATRVSEYVRGVFGHPHVDTDDTPIDSFTFNQAVDVLFAESVSIITFTHITGTSRHTRTVTAGRKEVEDALVRIFNHFKDTYPLPDCNELKYLFIQCDEDKDGRLNIQEFHIFLSIYLRYYKFGIQSNRFAATIMMDKVFMFVIENEEGLGAKHERTEFLRLAFRRFLQMSVHDKIQNQMAHLFFTKFDTDGSGAIDRNEFAALLSFFHAPTDEIDVLFIAADTDGSGQIDFSEFVVVLTTLLRKLVADFGSSLLHATGRKTTIGDTYQLFYDVEQEEHTDLISPVEFGEIWSRVSAEGYDSLDPEDFTRCISDVISYIRSKIRILEDAQITAVAGIDVDNTTPYEIIAIKEEASEQVGDDLYVDTDIPDDIEDLIDIVEEETEASIEEIQDAVASQIEGATIADVIEIVAYASSEAVIESVATAALEEIETTDCPTRTQIVEAIDSAIENGAVDAVVAEIEHLTPEQIIETVAQDVEAVQIAQEATQAVELSGDLEADTIIESVADQTGTELSAEDIVGIIGDATGAETVEEVVEIIENSSTEELIDTVTEVITEQVTAEPEHTEWQYETAVIDQIEENSGVSIDDVEAAIEDEIGASLDDAIAAATEVATEEIVDIVTDAVIEEATSTDCPTVETVEEAIEQVIEDGAVEEIIDTIEEASTEEIIEAVEGAIEEIEHHEEVPEEPISEADDSWVEENIEEEPVDIADHVEEETGYTGDEIDEAIEAELGDATIEDVVEAAETIATEEVLEAVTEAVVEQAEANDCVTEEGIQEAIEEVIEDGTVDEIIEELEEAQPEDIVETISQELGGDWHDEPEPYNGPEIVEEIETDQGYTEGELEAAVEQELGGASIEDVIDAVETVATEEVVNAVTEAVLEEAQTTDCLTEEDIQEVIEEVIEDGTVDEIIEDLEDTTPAEVVETVTEVIEEEHYETPEEHVEDNTGYTEVQIEQAVEDEIDGATIEDVIEAAETIATEEVLEAVTEAVVEQAEANDCVTEEGIQEAIEEVIEDGTVDEIIEDIQETPADEVIEAVTEVVEEDHHESHQETILEGLTEDLGYGDVQIEEAVEAQTGADIGEVIDAAEAIATEEVLDAVAEAVIEEAESNGCPTEESIHEVIEEVIEDGIVEDIVEELEDASPEDIVETVTEVIEEDHHDEGLIEQIAQETGYDEGQIEAAVEAETGVTIDEVVYTAEDLAAQEVVNAVADAVLAEAVTSDCPTHESIEAAIDQVIEGGTIDHIVEAIEETAPEDIVAAVGEAVEENAGYYSSFLERSNKSRLRSKKFLSK